ncbi:MAG: TIGR02281 family clan AA aspartic protease [Beijerinckiaceae bacterium]
MKIFVGILIAAIAVLAVLKFGDAPLGGNVRFGHALEMMMYGAIVVSMAGSLVVRYRGRLGTAALSALAWVAIFGVVIVGYSYRQELSAVSSRVMDEVVPGRSIASAPGQAIAVRGANGHFVLEGIANGRTLDFMFDTGASAVVLKAEDAAKAGFTKDKLQYTAAVSTANGQALAAPIRIDALSIGGITLRDVRALVAQPGAMRDNLLGMSFLGRLTSYTVRGNRLILQQ